MVGETAFPSPSEQSGATARPWGGRLVGMGTKKADRLPPRSLARPFRNLRLDLRQLWVTVDQPRIRRRRREEGKERAGREGKKAGRPQDSPSEQESVRPSASNNRQSVCVNLRLPPSFVRGTGTAGSMGKRRFTHPSFPTLRSNSLPHDEYIATATGVVCGKLRGREGTTRKDFI